MSYNIFDCLNTAKGILVKNASIIAKGLLEINNSPLVIDIPTGKKFVYNGYAITGSGNTVGYKLDRGAVVAMDQDPSGLVATTEIDLDGVAKTYAGDLPNAGDYITGIRGSQFHR